MTLAAIIIILTMVAKACRGLAARHGPRWLPAAIDWLPTFELAEVVSAVVLGAFISLSCSNWVFQEDYGLKYYHRPTGPMQVAQWVAMKTIVEGVLVVMLAVGVGAAIVARAGWKRCLLRASAVGLILAGAELLSHLDSCRPLSGQQCSHTASPESLGLGIVGLIDVAMLVILSDGRISKLVVGTTVAAALFLTLEVAKLKYQYIEVVRRCDSASCRYCQAY